MKVRVTILSMIGVLTLGAAIVSNNASVGGVIPGAPSMLAAAQTHKGEGTVKKLIKEKARSNSTTDP